VERDHVLTLIPRVKQSQNITDEPAKGSLRRLGSLARPSPRSVFYDSIHLSLVFTEWPQVYMWCLCSDHVHHYLLTLLCRVSYVGRMTQNHWLHCWGGRISTHCSRRGHITLAASLRRAAAPYSGIAPFLFVARFIRLVVAERKRKRERRAKVIKEPAARPTDASRGGAGWDQSANYSWLKGTKCVQKHNNLARVQTAPADHSDIARSELQRNTGAINRCWEERRGWTLTAFRALARELAEGDGRRSWKAAQRSAEGGRARQSEIRERRGPDRDWGACWQPPLRPLAGCCSLLRSARAPSSRHPWPRPPPLHLLPAPPFNPPFNPAPARRAIHPPFTPHRTHLSLSLPARPLCAFPRSTVGHLRGPEKRRRRNQNETYLPATPETLSWSACRAQLQTLPRHF